MGLSDSRGEPLRGYVFPLPRGSSHLFPAPPGLPGSSADLSSRAISSHRKAQRLLSPDSIPHDKLQACLRMRIADRAVLKLIWRWLETPMVEVPEGKGAALKVSCPQKGTPQGGVGVNLCISGTLRLLESRMREILTSGSTRGEDVGLRPRFSPTIQLSLCTGRRERGVTACGKRIAQAVFVKKDEITIMFYGGRDWSRWSMENELARHLL